jgi:transposase
MRLTDEQWNVLAPIFDAEPTPARGRPRIPDRDVLDGVLWVLKTGARWHDLPERYPSPATCHRRFQAWNRSGLLARALKALADDLVRRGGLDLSECAVGATFAPAKKGAQPSGRPSAGRGPRSWPSQTAQVFLSPSTWRALPRMRRRWLRRRLRPALRAMRRDAFSVIAPTIATLWTESWPHEASS